jgi:predicted glycosyltransferase
VSHKGFSKAAKTELVSALAEQGEVYITSESELPPEFEPYRLPIPPEEIHHLLYYANLYIGDSQTMATEAAVLGTPSIRSNTFAGDDDMGNFVYLEDRYGLLRSTDDEDEAIDTAQRWIDDPSLQSKWDERRQKLLDDTIDVTEYILEQIQEVAR